MTCLFPTFSNALETILGTAHPDTLSNMAELGSMYRDLGQWKEAEGLGLQVLHKREAEFGERHPDTLASMADLASAYSRPD